MEQFYIIGYDKNGKKFIQIGEYANNRASALTQAMNGNWKEEDRQKLHQVEIFTEENINTPQSLYERNA